MFGRAGGDGAALGLLSIGLGVDVGHPQGHAFTAVAGVTDLGTNTKVVSELWVQFNKAIVSLYANLAHANSVMQLSVQ